MRGFLVRNAFLPSFFATPSALTTQLLRPLSFERRSSFQLQTKKVFDDDVRSADDTKNYSDGESKASSLIDMATSAVETVGNNLDGSLTGEEDEIEIEPEASAEELTEEEIHEATEDETDGSAGIFDITGSLFDSDSPGFWSNIISFVDDDDDDDGNNRNGIFDMFSRDDETDDRVSSNIGVLASFEETSRTWMEMIQSADSDSISSVIAKAQDMKWQEEEDIEKTSLLEIHDAIQQCAAGISAGFDEFFGDEPVPIPTISSLQYYFERTDEIKTPSWKRRMHRFFPKIRVSEMEHINHKLQLARLAYANTVEEIRETLNNEYGCVLLYCDPRAKPNKPAHFVAVKKRQSKWKLTDSLEVYLVVCGTKTVLDIITDLICEAAPYRGGYAHAGMAESGIYLAEKHIDLLKRLRDESGRSRIKVHMLGHSLGAGSAGITAMEWNDHDFIDVEMTGFGCPALVSKDLAEGCTDFVTSVIADNDCIPRLSLASLVNALLDVAQFDYTEYARRDLEDVMDEIEAFLPDLLTGTLNREKIMANLNKLLPDKESFQRGPKDRMEVILRPPGTAIHFFFDGFGISASRVGSEFFNELDINRRMVHDHLFVSGYSRIMLETMRQHLNDNYCTFQTKEQKLK